MKHPSRFFNKVSFLTAWLVLSVLVLGLCFTTSHPCFAEASKVGITIDACSPTAIAPAGQSYQWYLEGQKIAGATRQEMPVTQTGNYSVETTDAQGRQVIGHAHLVVDQKAVRKIYLIGDSTVMTYGGSVYPQAGWGQVLPYYFNRNAILVENRAIGGRSSRSFHEEGRWNTVRNLLQPGDFVMIQFGHNDRDFSRPERYTDTTAYKEYLRTYIREIRAQKAHPILVTPMNMNTWNGTVLREVFRENANDYRGAMVRVGRELSVPVIDLNLKSRDLFQSLGREYITNHLFFTLTPGEYPNYPNGITDGTHFQEMGALALAGLVAEGMQEFAADSVVGALAAELVPLHRLTVQAEPATAGRYTGSGRYPAGVTVTLKAEPKAGFFLGGWFDAAGNRRSSAKMFSFAKAAVDETYNVTFDTDPNNTVVYDCHSVANGTAYLDGCNVCVGGTTGLKPCLDIAEGTYVVKPVNSNLCLELGQTLVQQACTGTPEQTFRFRKNGAYYEIQSGSSGKYLHHNSVANGTDIGFADTPTGGLFRAEDAGNGAYHFAPATAPGSFLDVNSRSLLAGAKIILWTRGTGTNQMFRLEPSSVTSTREAEAKPAWSVYPNPSGGNFQIACPGAFRYRVVDGVGREVLSGFGTDALELGSGLPPGLFLLHLQTWQTSRTLRLIKK